MKLQSEYLRLFIDITKVITASLDPKEVFDLIVNKIPQILHVDAATIRLLDPSGQKLVLEAASGLSDTYLNRGPIDAEESVLKALEGTPIAISDAANDSRIDYPEAARQEGIQSILVAPIPIRGKSTASFGCSPAPGGNLIHLRLNSPPPWQSNAASPSKMRESMTSSGGS